MEFYYSVSAVIYVYQIIMLSLQNKMMVVKDSEWD